MKLELVIAQLRARCPTFAQRVAGAAEYQIVPESTAISVPAAFVIPLADDPEENGAETGVRQRLVETFGVVVALSNVTDERGQTAYSAVHEIRKEIWKALLGWVPDEDYGAVQYAGGNLVQLDRARLWWQFEFSSDFHIGDEDGWLLAQQNQLPHFEGATIKVDVIDPIANPRPGPDGRIEHEVRIDNLPS